MKKIPTLFERDWEGDRSYVLNSVAPGCEWVQAGEGVATRKIDGTCCLVRGGVLYKRYETKKEPPPDFEECEFDETTGKRVGWRPVGEGPEDKWHRAAWTGCDTWPDGTYELIGPKVQGNPEGKACHLLIRHGGGPAGPIDGVPTDFNGLRTWLYGLDIEGIVWHHPDGRMAKIKKRDFGLRRR